LSSTLNETQAELEQLVAAHEQLMQKQERTKKELGFFQEEN